jgi:hypothetical protein
VTTSAGRNAASPALLAANPEMHMPILDEARLPDLVGVGEVQIEMTINPCKAPTVPLDARPNRNEHALSAGGFQIGAGLRGISGLLRHHSIGDTRFLRSFQLSLSVMVMFVSHALTPTPN